MDKDNANPDEIPLLPKTCTIGLIVCVCAFFSTVLTLVWLLVPASAFPFSKTSVIGYTVITLSRLILCLLLPVIVFTKMFRIPETKILGTNPGMGAFLLSLLIGCPASLMFVSLHNLLLRLFLVKGLSLAQPAFSFVSDDASIESRMLVFAVVFLIPILLQELFFRGLLFSAFPRGMAGYQRILLSAFFFSIFLLSPVDFIPFFLLGILLGYIRHATNNILCPIITQSAMLATYFLFARILPYTDLSEAGNSIHLQNSNLTSEYTAITALVISLLAFVPVMAQIRMIAGDNVPDADLSEDDSAGSIREQFGWSFWLGLLFFAASWVLLLGI